MPLLAVHRLGALALVALALVTSVASSNSAHRRRDMRALTDRQVDAIARLDPPEWESVTSGHLEKLLIPRVSGTDNNTVVQEYISSVFSKLGGWHEEKYATRMKTPMGEKPFTNLVYTFDPDAPRRLVLSAHFDSKWLPLGGVPQFIGAVDSAAPCATIIDVAEALTPLLKARAARLAAGKPLHTSGVDEAEAARVTLQLIFFDGEEAFDNWSAQDSVYGSRHLAKTWGDTLLPDTHPLHASLAKRRMGALPNVLDTMDVLVLLDLLGAPKPRLRGFYPETQWLFAELAATDRRLREGKLVDAEDEKWFSDRPGHGGMVDDDHRPFLQRGVPVLHLIPLPFPDVWHNLKDNADALDLNVLRRWNRIMRVFTAAYLGLAADDDDPTAVTSTTNDGAEAGLAGGDEATRSGDEPRRRMGSDPVQRSELVRTPA